MHGCTMCDLIPPISLLPLYGFYFILSFCFYDIDFTCGLKVCQRLVMNSCIIFNAYKLLVTNLSFFKMLSFFCFYFIAISG